MKLSQVLCSTLVGLGFGMVSGAASAVALPVSNVMSTTIYNDFAVYSLDLLKKCAAAGDSNCIPSGPLPVAANAGFTKNQLQVFTGENGGDQTTNTPNPLVASNVADNPFASPSGGDGNLLFGSAASPETAPSFTGDRTGKWDVTIGALRGYLGTNDLVFIFDNSQQGNTVGNWLQIWGRAEVVDTAGAVKACYQLSTDGPGCVARTNPTGVGAPGDPANGSYVVTYTAYCVSKGPTASNGNTPYGVEFDLGLANNDTYCGNKNGYFVDGNDGSAAADNAAFSKGLNDFVFAPTTNAGWLLSLDVRTFNNNGGGETLFICSDCKVSQQTPEPASLALLGLGLLGLVASRRRRA